MATTTGREHYAKDEQFVQTGVTNLDYEDDRDVEQVDDDNYDPAHDKRDMKRLGKRQELKRRFKFFSIIGYVVVLGLTWEFTLVTSTLTLTGGLAGAIWITFIVCWGMFAVCLSMAEMASMAPTSGGQYHWVSEFAPPHLQKELSYAVGWLVALGWQSAMPTVAYVAAQQVLALIVVCKDDYIIQGWHGALLTMAFVLAAISFNTFAIGKLPVLEILAVSLHFVGFIVFIAVLWAFGTRTDAYTTFTQFEDPNNWGSLGVATLVGILGPTTTYLGSDSAVHLAEELQDASYLLPRAMITSAIINYILGFVMIITFMFNLGDLGAASESNTQQVWVAVIYNSTGSKAATIVLLVVMIVLYFFCAVNQVTTSSRQVFAFARDKGLPFHRWLSRVSKNGVPNNSVYLTLVFTCLLALIIIGSPTAFQIILSLSATGLFTSYFIVIGTVLYRRFKKQPFPASRFTLGRYGYLVNISAMCFLLVTFVFLFFPLQPDTNADNMNWSILIYGVVVIFSFIYYLAYGRKEYDGPTMYVRHEWDNRLQ